MEQACDSGNHRFMKQGSTYISTWEIMYKLLVIPCLYHNYKWSILTELEFLSINAIST